MWDQGMLPEAIHSARSQLDWVHSIKCSKHDLRIVNKVRSPEEPADRHILDEEHIGRDLGDRATRETDHHGAAVPVERPHRWLKQLTYARANRSVGGFKGIKGMRRCTDGLDSLGTLG